LNLNASNALYLKKNFYLSKNALAVNKLSTGFKKKNFYFFLKKISFLKKNKKIFTNRKLKIASFLKLKPMLLNLKSLFVKKQLKKLAIKSIFFLKKFKRVDLCVIRELCVKEASLKVFAQAIRLKKKKKNLIFFTKKKIQLFKQLYFFKIFKSSFFLNQAIFLFYFFLPKKLLTFFYNKIKYFLKKKFTSITFFKLQEVTLSLLDFSTAYLKKKKTKIKKAGSFFFFCFLAKFFTTKFQIKTSLNFISVRNSIKKYDIFAKLLTKKSWIFFKKFNKNFKTITLIKIFFFCFKLKNLTLFANWLKFFLEKIHFKFHKSFLKSLNFFIFKFFYFFKKKFKITGFFLDVRGKVSVSGNAKKRHFFIKKGALSKSRKSNKFFTLQNQVKTSTGLLGLTYMLTH